MFGVLSGWPNNPLGATSATQSAFSFAQSRLPLRIITVEVRQRQHAHCWYGPEVCRFLVIDWESYLQKDNQSQGNLDNHHALRNQHRLQGILEIRELMWKKIVTWVNLKHWKKRKKWLKRKSFFFSIGAKDDHRNGDADKGRFPLGVVQLVKRVKWERFNIVQ